jgi:hypothetical protein
LRTWRAIERMRLGNVVDAGIIGFCA